MLERIAAGATDDNLPLFSEGNGQDGSGRGGILASGSVNGLSKRQATSDASDTDTVG
jgi:hypothetical protein